MIIKIFISKDSRNSEISFQICIKLIRREGSFKVICPRIPPNRPHNFQKILPQSFCRIIPASSKCYRCRKKTNTGKDKEIKCEENKQHKNNAFYNNLVECTGAFGLTLPVIFDGSRSDL